MHPVSAGRPRGRLAGTRLEDFIDWFARASEAGLTFAVNKNRREQRDFPGAARIVKELADGPARVCVALKVLEGAPAREGAEIADADGKVIGVVTSGGFGPSLIGLCIQFE